MRNLNEIYGGMAPDVFNYLFSNIEWLDYLYNETHYANFLSVWKKADTILEKSVAFGFVSHNGITGADAIAHGNYDYEYPNGWVIAKALEMAKRSDVSNLLLSLGLAKEGEDGETVISGAGYELCHNFVESAVDLLIAQHDRRLGGKILAAALSRTSKFPELLVKVYSEGFKDTFELKRQTAVTVIRSAENEFRKNMVSYGFALMQDFEVAKGLIADQLAALAPGFLSAYGITLSEDPSDLNVLSNVFLDIAIDVCKDGYFSAVMNTIEFVSRNLAKMGISY